MTSNVLPPKGQHTIDIPPSHWEDQPATQSQRTLIAKLRHERDDTGMGATPEDLTKVLATRAIDWLLARPRKAQDAPPKLPVGLYEADGQVYRVEESMSTGSLYAMTLDMTQLDGVEPGDKPVWNYGRPHPSYRELCALRPDPISPETAARMGHLFQRCIFCSRPLSDKPSVVAGYGARCAELHGMPWGEA